MNTTMVLQEVAEQAERIKNDAEQVLVIVDPGDEIRQGDVYITVLKGLPHDLEKLEGPSRQLAPGDTQGSRHCLRSLDGMTVYRLRNPGPLDGPIVVGERGLAIDHPEHANIVIEQLVTVAITYQRAFADELRRVAD